MTATTPRVLVVEDDAKLGAQIVEALHTEGLETNWLQDGDAAMLAPFETFSLVVLDLMLPGAYGLDVLKRLRQQCDVPVLVLSARNDTTDKVRALELGADDFVTKPFWPDELMARVRARLRRPVLQRDGVLQLEDLTVDLAARRVDVNGGAVELTRVEFDLLATLARRPGTAVSRTALADAVLDPHRDGNERTLDVHFSRLRKKLGRCGGYIATVWGVGYRLDAGAT